MLMFLIRSAPLLFTVNAYYSMFTGMLTMEKNENLPMVPRMLPILLAAGTDDPVGNFGRGREEDL